MVERRRGVIPPQQRRPERRQTPRSLILRRRLIALGMLAALVIGLTVAIAGSHHGKKAQAASRGRSGSLRIVFPEGFTREQMAVQIADVAKIAEKKRGVRPALSRADYLAATRAPRRQPGFGLRPLPLEGFLFPATYDFTASTISRQLVASQLSAFRRNWGKIDLAYARAKHLMPYDVLTIASMIEKEARSPDERGLVSAVIYNRLHAHMYLSIDATIRYAFHVSGTEALRESQLSGPSPYNLRHNYGLPPTPISNPGLASIQAAAHPAHVGYLYYVAKPDRVHHFFTANFSAFENYKRTHGYR